MLFCHSAPLRSGLSSHLSKSFHMLSSSQGSFHKQTASSISARETMESWVRRIFSCSFSRPRRLPTDDHGPPPLVTKGTPRGFLQSFFFEVSHTVFSPLCLSVTVNGIWWWVVVNIGQHRSQVGSMFWLWTMDFLQFIESIILSQL